MSHKKKERSVMIRSAIKKQFHEPRGWLGRVIGFYLQHYKTERNRWGAELLDIQPTDIILEIGFGPGVAIKAIAVQITSGKVIGIDPSPLMVKQASHLNA